MSLWMPKKHFSISQKKQINTCPRLYYYQYVEGLGDITPHLIAGGAAHAALEYGYGQQLQTGTFAATVDVLDVFNEEWKKGIPEITNWTQFRGKQRTASDFTQISRAHLLAHIKEIAPNIVPKRLEGAINVEFQGIPLVGFVDMETADTIYDHKFRFSPGPPPLDVKTDLQLTLYALARGKSKVGFIMHYLEQKTNRKTGGRYFSPALSLRKATRTKDDFEYLEKEIVQTVENIDRWRTEGDFPRIPEKTCPAWCEFRSRCWANAAQTNEEIKKRLQSEDPVNVEKPDTSSSVITHKCPKKEEPKLFDELMPEFSEDSDRVLPF